MTQCFIAFLFTVLPMFIFEDPSFNNIFKDAYEILYVGVLSSGLAFLLQTYSLQNLTPAPAAIIFSLEGVFAAIFAWLILDQFLNEVKILGIFLILFFFIFLNSKNTKKGSRIKNPTKNLPTLKVWGPIKSIPIA